MEEVLATYGGPGLLLVAFVSATLVPLSSEAAVVAVLSMGMPPTEVLVWASLGNCLGVSLNYLLGRIGRSGLATQQKDGNSRTSRVLRWLDRFGPWGLALSWLPVIGDPLTVAAGVARVNIWFFIAVAFGVRVARYWVLVVAFG